VSIQSSRGSSPDHGIGANHSKILRVVRITSLGLCLCASYLPGTLQGLCNFSRYLRNTCLANELISFHPTSESNMRSGRLNHSPKVNRNYTFFTIFTYSSSYHASKISHILLLTLEIYFIYFKF